jgi:tetratricopeptide (TPR) repeat protein
MGQESRFFADGSGDHEYDYDADRAGGVGAGWIVVLVIAVIGIVAIFMSQKDEPTEPSPIAHNTTPAPPPETIAPPPTPVEPPGLGPDEALAYAGGYGMEVGAAAMELTTVLSGADLLAVTDAGSGADVGVGQAVKPPIVAAVVEKPPVDKPPVVRPPVVKKPPVDKTPPKITSGSLSKAQRLVKQEKFDKALPILRQLSKQDSQNKQVAYLHGLAAFSSNKNAEAITHLSRAERLGHRTGPLYLDLAAAYQLDGKKDRAKWAYEKFLKIQPNGRMADEVRTILSTRF